MIMGFAIGAAFISSTQLGVVDVAPEDAGIGSGIVNMSQQLGAAAGVALLGTIAASRTSALQHHGVPFVEAVCRG
jgi:hypothetical protein